MIVKNMAAVAPCFSPVFVFLGQNLFRMKLCCQRVGNVMVLPMVTVFWMKKTQKEFMISSLIH